MIVGWVDKQKMSRTSPNKLHHLSWLHGIELYEANFRDRRFGKHAHGTFAIGSIICGVGGYLCRGESHVLPQGRLSLMNPEEVHTGHALGGNLSYKMVYVSERAVEAILGLPRLRGFRELAPEDKSHDLTSRLAQFSHDLASRGIPAWRLRVEETMTDILALAFTRYGGADRIRPGQEPGAVVRARDYIDAHVDSDPEDKLNLQCLAHLVDLHPNYLIQVFSDALGISPYAYLLQRKIDRAKQLILAGEAPVAVATSMGFFDQPHFIRHFRKVTGVTPGNLLRY